MPRQPHQTGLIIKREPDARTMLVHPETFMDFINSLPRNENGWVKFNWWEEQSQRFNGQMIKFKAVQKAKR